jgi:hypothetical protein
LFDHSRLSDLLSNDNSIPRHNRLHIGIHTISQRALSRMTWPEVLSADSNAKQRQAGNSK